MLQITTDISNLNRAQREAVSGFVLNFPPPTPSDQDITDDEDIVRIPPFSLPDEDDGDLEAAAIFGKQSPASISDDRLDKVGLPWDDRIHASSRAKTADGYWRRKRGVDDALVAQVESELKALMQLPMPAPILTDVPPLPAAPVPPPPPAASTANDRKAYVALISKASAAINAKKLTQEQLVETVVAAGVPSLPLLANRLDLVPQVMAAIEALIG